MFRRGSLLFGTAMLASTSALGGGVEDIIQNSYRRAVVKIATSSNEAVFDETGKNICRSEGTGFLVDRQHIITAEHVYKLDNRCGVPIVFARSNRLNWQSRVEIVSARDDVALLKAASIPESNALCSLVIASKDVFETSGFRYGIPDGLLEAEPIALRIGDDHGQFPPFVVLTPSPIYPGDSGGPILYQFNVVGLMKARHEKYPSYGLMIRAETIRQVLAAKNISSDDSSCNPAKTVVSGGSAVIGFPSFADGVATQKRISTDLKIAMLGIGSNDFEIVSQLGSANPSVEIRPSPGYHYSDSSRGLRAVTDAISSRLVERWWASYMDLLQGRQENKSSPK